METVISKLRHLSYIKVIIMNAQIGIVDSKSLVVSDLLLFGHLKQRMRSDRVFSHVEKQFAKHFFLPDSPSLTCYIPFEVI